MNRELHEGLVNVAMYLGVVDAPEHIETINDAMDKLRLLEQQLKDERDTVKKLEQKLIRKTVRRYHTIDT